MLKEIFDDRPMVDDDLGGVPFAEGEEEKKGRSNRLYEWARQFNEALVSGNIGFEWVN